MTAVLRACYRLKGRVVRPGRVKVARYVKPAARLSPRASPVLTVPLAAMVLHAALPVLLTASDGGSSLARVGPRRASTRSAAPLNGARAAARRGRQLQKPLWRERPSPP